MVFFLNDDEKKGKRQRQSEEIFFTLLTSVNKRASDRAEKNIEK